MIKTKLERADALEILSLGLSLHQESRFSDTPFDEDKCWKLLEATLVDPSKYFIAFDDKYRGFILMGLHEHYFSSAKEASDYCIYISPEHRGGMLVVRLLKAAIKWATENGAKDITIYHNTGIDTLKAPKLFEKLGLPLKGYIFNKELQHV